MEPYRKHIQKMKLTESMACLSKNGKMVVSGQNGQDVLNYYNKTIDKVFS